MANLYDTAPAFDEPIAVIRHCHERIRKQLTTLDKLVSYLPDRGVDESVQAAAKAVLKYFNKAAPLHHQDEEVDLLPALRATVQGEDAHLLEKATTTILQHHKEMDRLWQTLRAQLEALEDGSGYDLSAADVEDFSALYREHMALEEGQIAPLAMRVLSEQQMRELGASMQERRGIVPAT
ncbi:hemerythrin domain-containing protein [Undibacterium luofuense]|uniref:Hemerythrin domain-containing protein n=1 Tax=Undibacterium luofuense TaxID=2828733 RepID=A0A941DSB5_9BURK|nr:hemerythrin domain-containing protein [Undibacterium luofuense]MBR7783136.1 hemerythrin domain-containing protein [Undibacterium luofuense]